MKRITIGAAFTIACATVITPIALNAAHADPTPGAAASGSVAQLQTADTHKALTAAAQSDARSLATSVGLGADDAFTVKNVVKDADGSTHVHVNRTYKGLPVIGGDLIIHRDASGKVTGHDGMFDGAITVDLQPTLKAADAAPRGLAAAKSHNGQEGLEGAKASAGQLVVFVGQDGAQRLAYHVTTTGLQKDRTPSRVSSFVDADSGAAISSYDTIHVGSGKGIYVGTVDLSTTKSSGQYLLQNPATGNYSTDSGNKKVDGTTFTDSDDVWGTGSNSNRQSAGVDAQYGADKTFDFYKQVMGRNGIWDNGKGARSRVHYDTNYTNAFWDGQQMTYGDGAGNNHPLTELDVAGHEMTHGVTENTAGLVYEGDAGGLNEATSDIMGTMVEWYANNASDKPDYLIGETIDLNGDGTPLRYMDKPSKDGASYDCWSSTVGSSDPHLSSGPLNHWFYLASEGSGSKTINGVTYNSPTCNNSTVKGDNKDNVSKVWYRTLSTKLTSTSNYKAAREGAIKSAIELYGASSQTCSSVEKAFDAIAVPAGSAKCSGGTPTPTPTPTPKPTTPAPTPTTPVPTPTPTTPAPTPTPVPGSGIVNGDFEQGTTGWTGATSSITDDAGQSAHSGSWKLWLGGNGSTGTESVQQAITVPSKGKLTFWMHVDSDETTSYSKRDTAKVQLVDPSLRITYTLANYSNLDENSGYKQVSLDLSNYAGKKMNLVFTASEDSMNQTSFVIDDVAVR